jgi:radical SAM protein with 4Fe4S-binding SPASM domain
LSGFGEPLMNKELPRMFECVKKKGLKTLLLTNGSLLTDEYYKKLKNNVDSIRISVYGHSPEVYSKVHGCSTSQFFITYRNINGLIENKACEIILNYIVLDSINDHETGDWIRTWEDKVDLVEVWKPHNWATGKDYREISGERSRTCGRPFNGPLQVQVDGTVNVCCFDYNGETVIGDLKTQSLEEIFSSEKFNKIVTAHTTGEYDDMICATCDQRNENKDGIMIYNSRYDIDKRIRQTSTNYEELTE